MVRVEVEQGGYLFIDWPRKINIKYVVEDTNESNQKNHRTHPSSHVDSIWSEGTGPCIHTDTQIQACTLEILTDFISFFLFYCLGVGKTSLVVRYVQRSFSGNCTSTIGASFMTKKLWVISPLFFFSYFFVLLIPSRTQQRRPWKKKKDRS